MYMYTCTYFTTYTVVCIHVHCIYTCTLTHVQVHVHVVPMTAGTVSDLQTGWRPQEHRNLLLWCGDGAGCGCGCGESGLRDRRGGGGDISAVILSGVGLQRGHCLVATLTHCTCREKDYAEIDYTVHCACVTENMCILHVYYVYK